MTTRSLLPLFAGLLLMTGCRDALVDANASLSEPTPVVEYPDMYFKGPDELALGGTGSYRVQAVNEATEYRWTFISAASGQLEGTVRADSQGMRRIFQGTAVEPGAVTISVVAYDAEGNLLASTAKRVLISML